ncbi:ABC transporter substrate-binding protein [Nocardiopsis aegyptia]|uniref:Multiple sugar transport system substrate-binding protein n=1 Tax=Nocardiopsis aegyptia TaxID=220378 RepID=A0A7Z0J9W6_9ACTN|nr:extracellular solute-binding protein [Nocardiopsis aegyptia]NYJ34501.1 multiple sugar transport system substrate-binding protein [Nocardiopsis aegyptia]
MHQRSGDRYPRIRRRRPLLSVAAGAAAVVLAATACGSGTEDGVTELHFSWWGSDVRHAIFQDVIEAFEAQNPGVRVVGNYTDWSSYWDRLATDTAAGDAPDVIMQEEAFLREYSDRGALADLSELDGLDRSNLDPMIAESGDVDGRTFGVASGVNSIVILADPVAFEEAGVEMPDDETWTWDDFVAISAEISEATGGEIVGTQSITNEQGFQIFARQRGENLYDENGGLAFSQDTLTDWYRITEELVETGGQPGPAESVEIAAGGPEQSVLATNRGAMGMHWVNQIGAIGAAADRELEILRMPGETENERTGMFYKPSTYYTVSAGSEHPEEATAFVDFLVNSEEAAELVQMDLGLPSNLETRESVTSDLSGTDLAVAEFLTGLEDSIVDGNPPPPIGAGEVVNINNRVAQDTNFGELTPEEASAQFISEVESFIGDQE